MRFAPALRIAGLMGWAAVDYGRVNLPSSGSV